MRKSLIVCLVFATALAAISCAHAFSFSKTKTIFKQGQDTWVKIKKGNKKIAPFDHPHEFTTEDMKGLLSSLRYTRPKTFSLEKAVNEYDMFTPEEIEMMAEPLAMAFGQAGPEEWIDFSVNTFRGQMIIGSFKQSDGVMFVKDGKLNVAFRNISQKKAPDEELNTYDPTKGYRSAVKLAQLPNTQLIEENWIAIALGDLPGISKPAEENSEQANQPVEQKSVKERLVELQKLYDDGLITEEEYNQKRKEILEDL